MEILQLSNINVFVVYKSYFSIKNVAKNVFGQFGGKNDKVKKSQFFFRKSMDYNPLYEMHAVFQLLNIKIL